MEGAAHRALRVLLSALTRPRRQGDAQGGGRSGEDPRTESPGRGELTGRWGPRGVPAGGREACNLLSVLGRTLAAPPPSPQQVPPRGGVIFPPFSKATLFHRSWEDFAGGKDRSNDLTAQVDNSAHLFMFLLSQGEFQAAYNYVSNIAG